MSLGAREVVDQARIQVARAGAHHQSRRGREAHAGVDAPAVAHGSQAGAIAEMGEDHAAPGRRGIAADELLHQIGVRQAVKAVAHDALCAIAPRNRQQPCDSRHGAMKGSVEAHHLGQSWSPLRERLDQPDLAPEVFGVIRRDAAQLLEPLRRDPLGFRMPHPVHHAMPHGLDRRKYRLRLEPIQEKARGRAVVAGGKAAGDPGCVGRLVHEQRRAARSDSIDLPVESSPERRVRVIDCEPDARRASVDGEQSSEIPAGTVALPYRLLHRDSRRRGSGVAAPSGAGRSNVTRSPIRSTVRSAAG